MEHLKITEQTEEYAVVEGYGVLFNVKDLEGETFTPQTDYATEYIKGQTVYLDHAQDDIVEEDGTTYHLKAVRQPVGQVVGVDVTDAGLYFRLKLKKAAEYWDYVSRVLSTNKCGLSTGTAPHLMEKSPDGIIKMWHVKEISLTMTPAESRTTKYLIRTKTLDNNEAGEVKNDNPVSDSASDSTETLDNQNEDNMSEEILKALAALDARLDKMEAQKADPPTPANDPGMTPAAKNVNVVKDASHWRYDRLSFDDLAFSVATLNRISHNKDANGFRPSDAIVKALAMRLESGETKTDDAVTGAGYSDAIKFMKSLGLKSNEINQSTLANYGDDWVGTSYGTSLWEKIRQERRVFGLFESAGRVVQAPRGADVFIDPLESTDPTVYGISQAADYTSNPGGVPSNTVPVNKFGTAKQTTSLGKFGSSTAYTGELDEDSFINIAPQLRAQIQNAFSETFESALIDGDTATATNTNINYITGTPSDQYWLQIDGLRKLALVTNSANAENINGALAAANFLTVAKLMGDSGINADIEKTVFLLDPKTYFAAIALSDVKSKDVNSAMTIETGVLTRIWGYNLYRTAFMAWPSTTRLTNTAGKIDNTTAGNNTKGQILAFRPDQWKVYIRNLMKQTVQYIPRADTWEITTIARMGFNYRDTEAAAIGYNITV